LTGGGGIAVLPARLTHPSLNVDFSKSDEEALSMPIPDIANLGGGAGEFVKQESDPSVDWFKGVPTGVTKITGRALF
jgi:hypothetical protein